jgi:hypothetical protein
MSILKRRPASRTLDVELPKTTQDDVEQVQEIFLTVALSAR